MPTSNYALNPFASTAHNQNKGSATVQDRKTKIGTGKGEQKGGQKHTNYRNEGKKRWRPEEEESSREHNLQARNGPQSSVELNSPVLCNSELS